MIKRFLTYILKLHCPWYMLTDFQSNVGSISTGPTELGFVCIDLALLTWLSTAIIAVLVASIATHIIDCVMLWSFAIVVSAFLKSTLYESACFL